MSIDLTNDDSTQRSSETSSSVLLPTVVSSSVARETYTSSSIKQLLIRDKNHYKVLPNPNNRATAACWTKFGFPGVRKNNEENGEFSIIRGFASCKVCFDTYLFNDSSTTNLNNHRCSLDERQSWLPFNSSSSPVRNAIGTKIISKKKDNLKKLCASWMASSMRPFSIVTDPGFKHILQECLTIGQSMKFLYLNNQFSFLN
jgi:hypothetical protein